MDNIHGSTRQGAVMEKSLTDCDMWQLQHQESYIECKRNVRKVWKMCSRATLQWTP